MVEKTKKIVDALATILDEKIGIDVFDDTQTTTLENYGLDSLDRVEFCLAVEKHFEIRINDDLIEDWGKMSVNSIAEQISFLITNV